jgi:hypothetical protein
MKNVFKLLNITAIILLLVACSSDNPGGNNANTQDISSLNLGDRIVDTGWTWEFRHGYGYTHFGENEKTGPVVWVVVAKDHYQANTVTLISENLLGFYPYDSSTISSGLLAGKNQWNQSGETAPGGIRPWLNSTGNHADEGFYKAFSAEFKGIVIATEIENKEYDTGTTYTTTDNVFIPSHTEMGATSHDGTYVIGKPYEYFVGADYIRLRSRILGESWERDYWTRSPYSAGYRPVGMITTNGIYASNFADFNNLGVRAVVNVGSSVKVTKEPNAEGIFEINY